MIGELQNVLYVQTDGVVLRLDHDNVVITQDRAEVFRVPAHHISGIVALGRVSLTGPLTAMCAERGMSIAQFKSNGRFEYRIEGRRSGNVLLRAAQHRLLGRSEQMAGLVQAIIAGKLCNGRQVLLRSARDIGDPAKQTALRDTAEEIARDIRRLRTFTTIDQLRGVEGINAKRYFAQIPNHLHIHHDSFTFTARSKRPPRDPINALLSFLYSLLTNDCVSALEAVGLDPQVGYLHTLRPGRPSLALDLMEEFRPVLADRLAFTLINRQQVRPEHFDGLPGGAVSLNDRGRREVITAYQERKKDEFEHPELKQRVTYGTLPMVQARLLARAIRNERQHYIPFYSK